MPDSVGAASRVDSTPALRRVRLRVLSARLFFRFCFTRLKAKIREGARRERLCFHRSSGAHAKDNAETRPEMRRDCLAIRCHPNSSNKGSIRAVSPNFLITFQRYNRPQIGYRTCFAPGRARTCNPMIRSHILYTIELRGHGKFWVPPLLV